jgi:hypothetical protein
MCGKIEAVLAGHTIRETELKSHKITTVSALLYGSESWLATKEDNAYEYRLRHRNEILAWNQTRYLIRLHESENSFNTRRLS